VHLRSRGHPRKNELEQPFDRRAEGGHADDDHQCYETDHQPILDGGRPPVGTGMEPEPTRYGTPDPAHEHATCPRLDAGGDLVEQAFQVATEQGDGSNDDDGDQRNHQAVLDRGGATVAAQCSYLDLELDEMRKHVGPLHRTGVAIPEPFAPASLSA